MENPLNVDWFVQTPFGKAFDGLDEDLYDTLFALAEDELKKVKCNCASVYPYAIAIKISLMIPAFGAAADGTIVPGAQNATGHKAYVVEDSVYDTTRKYKLEKVDDQIAASTPSGILSGIIAKCSKPIISIGATLVRSFPDAGSCGCGPSGWGTRFGKYADKADN